jgi:adenylosuccinate synthase
VRNAVEFNGLDCINLTKLDVLTGVKEIKVATKYLLDGKELRTIPTTRKANLKLEVIYESFPGWEEDLSQTQNFGDLPENAQNYVKALEGFIKCPIKVIGVGMDRNDLIYLT